MVNDKVYKELEQLLGAENVSREPAVLDGYSWQTHINGTPDIWLPRAEAVVLPETTEEVQEIVRLCNRNALKYKALSTGWGGFAAPGKEGVVLLDLRRMNRIVEIDEENMIAVVEPYVIAGVLQAESMKRGLNTHIIGAGPSHSPLASATSLLGTGFDGIYMSTSFRNLLGVEWVSPSGEVIRLGSLGSDSGWFSGDGPGPSLRGILRGYLGAAGGFGVFTKVALKLFNWPGDRQPEIKGTVLDLETKIPKNFGNYICLFPDQQKYADANYKVGEAEIGYIHLRIGMPLTTALVLPRLIRKFSGKKGFERIFRTIRHQFYIMLAGSSQNEFEYQRKVMEAIVADQGGICLDLSMFPPLENLFWFNLVRATISPLVFRPTGSYMVHYGVDESVDSTVKVDDAVRPLGDKWAAQGTIIDQMGDDIWSPSYENVNRTHFETIRLFDPRTQQKEMLAQNVEFVMKGLEHHMNPGMAGIDPEVRKIFSPLAGNYNEYQKKFLAALDKNGTSDTTFYTDEA